MNRVHVVLVLAAMALAVAGCSSGPTGEPAVGSAKTKTDSTASTVAKSVVHYYGRAEIPADPQRVVVVDNRTVLGTALLLDVPVVGYTRQPTGPGILPYFEEAKLADAQDIGWVGELNLEVIAAVDPDLIIGTTGFVSSKGLYTKLSQIAPTVVFEIFGFTPWKDALRKVATVLEGQEGRERIEEGIAQYEQRVDKLRTALGDRTFSRTVTLANFRALDEIYVYTSEWCSGRALKAVGLVRPPDQQVDERISLSIELLPRIDADMIFYFVGSSSDNAKARAATAKIKQNPLWKTLEAVQRGQVYPVDKSYWFTCGTLQAQKLVLDDLERILLKNAPTATNARG